MQCDCVPCIAALSRPAPGGSSQQYVFHRLPPVLNFIPFHPISASRLISPSSHESRGPTFLSFRHAMNLFIQRFILGFWGQETGQIMREEGCPQRTLAGSLALHWLAYSILISINKRQIICGPCLMLSLKSKVLATRLCGFLLC